MISLSVNKNKSQQCDIYVQNIEFDLSMLEKIKEVKKKIYGFYLKQNDDCG